MICWSRFLPQSISSLLHLLFSLVDRWQEQDRHISHRQPSLSSSFMKQVQGKIESVWYTFARVVCTIRVRMNSKGLGSHSHFADNESCLQSLFKEHHYKKKSYIHYYSFRFGFELRKTLLCLIMLCSYIYIYFDSTFIGQNVRTEQLFGIVEQVQKNSKIMLI